MSYIDGFVLAVPKANREAYRELAEKSAALFKEFGALSIVEAWGEDVPEGEVTSFPMSVQCKPDESVVFSWITWPSKEVRTEGWAKMMSDARMQPDAMRDIFDGKRMIYGGFEPIVEG